MLTCRIVLKLISYLITKSNIMIPPINIDFIASYNEKAITIQMIWYFEHI